MEALLYIVIGMVGIYFLGRCLLAEYFRYKEEYVNRLVTKAKGKQNGVQGKK